jgi:hypothetical protein
MILGPVGEVALLSLRYHYRVCAAFTGLLIDRSEHIGSVGHTACEIDRTEVADYPCGHPIESL